MPPSMLVSWIGTADLEAFESGSERQGPLLAGLQWRAFDKALILFDWPQARVAPFQRWLAEQVPCAYAFEPVPLEHPMHFEQIYRGAVAALEAQGAPATRTYHLSPGSPAMAAIWLLLAKTRFPGALIRSSIHKGVEPAHVPFDIYAELMPELLRRPDAQLAQLSASRSLASAFEHIVTRDPALRATLHLAQRVALRSVPVLILGESGTGKELLARAIHQASPRGSQKMAVVNCGAIPANLIESELFGHEKGAFTGADKAREGRFSAAHRSTLFLDEVGDLPLSAQVKLLRAVQEGVVTPVGSNREQPVDVRLIAATHRDLGAAVARNDFRGDLFYRLAVAVLHLPPLRERRGDLNLLLDHLLDEINRQHAAEEPGYEPRSLSAGARNRLHRHDWPGNVRELYNTLVRASIWALQPSIRREDVVFVNARPPGAAKILGRPLGDGLDLRALLDQVKRHYLERALQTARGKTEAAELLGLGHYQTFDDWLRKQGLQSPSAWQRKRSGKRKPET